MKLLGVKLLADSETGHQGYSAGSHKHEDLLPKEGWQMWAACWCISVVRVFVTKAAPDKLLSGLETLLLMPSCLLSRTQAAMMHSLPLMVPNFRQQALR